MKRILALTLVLAIIFSLSACEDKSKTASKTGTSSNSETTDDIPSSTTTTVETVSKDDKSEAEGPETTISYVTSEITTTKPNQNLPDNVDISWHENPASICFPIRGEMDTEADVMREKILDNTTQSVKIEGTTYYVSEDGDDNADGKTEKTAWASLSGVAEHKDIIKAGDAVLFKRGDVFRGYLKLVDGVYYGAFGSGIKPCIYGSNKNYADSGFLNVGENIWRLKENFNTDVGIMVFNHGEAVGNRVDSRSKLSNDFDYYTDPNNDNRVYLYYEKDPNEMFLSIEIGLDERIFDFDDGKNITIENITFKYTGGHAVRGNNSENVTVRYCEIGYIGGCILKDYKDGTVRYGNGIEYIGSSTNALVEHNWIYQIYDSGITHQGDNCTVENFIARNNLVEYCGMGAIEYWHTEGAIMKNILYTENMLRFSGYGFGGYQRTDKNMSAAIQSNAKSNAVLYNKAENFVISNNIFELSTYQLINAAGNAGTPPTFSGNTYIQIDGKWLGYYDTNTNIRFNASSEAMIKNTWGDTKAKLIFK